MTTKIHSVKDLIAAINNDAKAPVELDAEHAYSADTENKLLADFSANMPTIKVEPNDKGEHQLTIENMDSLDKYRANFHEALGTVTAPLIAEKAKADPEIGAMEVKLKVGETTFSTAFARPTGDAPTQKELAASIGFGYSTIKNKGLEGKVRKDFAKLWLETEEEDEGDDE
ncbi:hypothetical protein pEaSNUABM8_00279 [Erwinia phage pEa_SNUABM_8]|nr:hypothetical protein pEaSNUABM8_00279 [Erwinia phage pEa_SNUABM_8]QVW55031.1 hypothetical protein pEaSNUABM4_00278 [Erwinia phage pEa_SNUABM_4]